MEMDRLDWWFWVVGVLGLVVIMSTTPWGREVELPEPPPAWYEPEVRTGLTITDLRVAWAIVRRLGLQNCLKLYHLTEDGLTIEEARQARKIAQRSLSAEEMTILLNLIERHIEFLPMTQSDREWVLWRLEWRRGQ